MDEFCWKQERFDVEISSSDKSDISFVQTGYAMTYDSTHAFDIQAKKG